MGVPTRPTEQRRILPKVYCLDQEGCWGIQVGKNGIHCQLMGSVKEEKKDDVRENG